MIDYIGLRLMFSLHNALSDAFVVEYKVRISSHFFGYLHIFVCGWYLFVYGSDFNGFAYNCVAVLPFRSCRGFLHTFSSYFRTLCTCTYNTRFDSHIASPTPVRRKTVFLLFDKSRSAFQRFKIIVIRFIIDDDYNS